MKKAQDINVKDRRNRDGPMYEKRRERKRQKSVGDQKYRRPSTTKRTPCVNSYKMSSTPRQGEHEPNLS